MLYISRNFVEFGPFKPEEILDFKKRAILLDSDYLRLDGTEEWLSVDAWVTKESSPAPEAPVKAKAAPKKKSAKKAA